MLKQQKLNVFSTSTPSYSIISWIYIKCKIDIILILYFKNHISTHYFSQFIEETDCCSSGVQGADCFTIQIPGNDRFYSWVNSSARCINVLRSRPVCRENVRQQYNEVTSFIDASNVYGSDEEHSSILRTYYDGRLQRNSISDQLPTMEQLNIRPEIRFAFWI